MLSKEFILELQDFQRIPGELVLAVMVMSGADIQTLDSWQRSVAQSFDMPPETGCAKVIYNAEHMDIAEHVIGEMKRELAGEYPELFEYLSEVYDGNPSDNLP